MKPPKERGIKFLLYMKKDRTTKSLRMENILAGESCGVCHLRVAFPLDDCRKCHPSMK